MSLMSRLTKKYEDELQKLKYDKNEFERLAKAKEKDLQELREQLKNSHADLKKFCLIEENYKLMEYEFEEKLINVNLKRFFKNI